MPAKRLRQSVMLDADLRRLLRRKRAEMDLSVSEIINRVLRKAFRLPKCPAEANAPNATTTEPVAP
mgnify:CR=1 FL=1